MTNLFTKHPQEVGETYWQHLWYAMKFGAKLVFCGILCMIHAIFPFLFEFTASDHLAKLVNTLCDGERGETFRNKLNH